jgi:ABC-type sulfate transport system permease subunit
MLKSSSKKGGITMKKVTIKRFTPGSVFKSVLMAITIPFIFFFGLFLLIVLIGGSYSNETGTGLALIVIITPFALIPVIYGLMFMLLAASYNWLTPKFGGLEIEAEDDSIEEVKEEEQK